MTPRDIQTLIALSSIEAHDEGCCCPDCEPELVSAYEVEAGEARAQRAYEREHSPYALG